MSVRKRQRGESRFQVQDNATLLCVKLIVLLQSDFGIDTSDNADAVGEWHACDNDMVEFSAAVAAKKKDISGASLILECDRGGLAYLKKYKTWLIEHFKEELWKYAQSMSYHIRAANTINPIFVREYENRRLHQDEAMSCCFHLIDLLEQMKEILHIRIAKINPIIELLHSERRLLHEWRKSDYKKYQGCMKNEKKLQVQAITAVKKDLLRIANTSKNSMGRSAPNMAEVIDLLLENAAKEYESTNKTQIY